MNRLIKIALLSGGIIMAADVALNPDKVKRVVNTAKKNRADVADWRLKKQTLNHNFQNLRVAIENSSPLIEEMTKDIDRFQFKIQPYLEKIETVTSQFEK